MLIKFTAVVVYTPVFLVPAMLTALLGGWFGHVYVRAQMSVKRELSNAKAPVLGVFGGAIDGLGKIIQVINMSLVIHIWQCQSGRMMSNNILRHSYSSASITIVGLLELSITSSGRLQYIIVSAVSS